MSLKSWKIGKIWEKSFDMFDGKTVFIAKSYLNTSKNDENNDLNTFLASSIYYPDSILCRDIDGPYRNMAAAKWPQKKG